MKEPVALTPLFSDFFETPDGARLYFESRGQGSETLVLVYGLACLMNHWHFQVEHFSRFLRVITVDLRGHHQSTRGSEDLNISLLARDLNQLIEHLSQNNPVHVAGHSFGVPIVMEAALQEPVRFRSLSLINGFARNPLQSTLGEWVVQSPLLFAQKLYEANPEGVQKIWSQLVENPLAAYISGWLGGFNLKLTDLHDIEIYLKGVSQVPLSVFFPLFDSMLKYDARTRLTALQTPTLVVGGDGDRITPLAYQKEMAQLIPRSEFVIVPYGSHCTQLDFPDYLNLRLEKFFSENKLD